MAVTLELVSKLKAKAALKDRNHHEAAKQRNGAPASPPLIASTFCKPGGKPMPSANARIPALHMHDGMWILPHTSPLHVFYNVGFFVWYLTQGESLAPWFRASLARKFRKYHMLHLLAQGMRRDGQSGSTCSDVEVI
jgi:hypothetical protein